MQPQWRRRLAGQGLPSSELGVAGPRRACRWEPVNSAAVYEHRARYVDGFYGGFGVPNWGVWSARFDPQLPVAPWNCWRQSRPWHSYADGRAGGLGGCRAAVASPIVTAKQIALSIDVRPLGGPETPPGLWIRERLCPPADPREIMPEAHPSFRQGRPRSESPACRSGKTPGRRRLKVNWSWCAPA